MTKDAASAVQEASAAIGTRPVSADALMNLACAILIADAIRGLGIDLIDIGEAFHRVLKERGL